VVHTQQAPSNTTPTVGPPAVLIKYKQTFDPRCPLFNKVGKMYQILAQITSQIILGPLYFWTAALYRKSKMNLATNNDRPITTPKSWSVGPPTLRTVGALGTQKGKSRKFLIYPLFQRPTPSRRPPILHQQSRPRLYS